MIPSIHYDASPFICGQLGSLLKTAVALSDSDADIRGIELDGGGTAKINSETVARYIRVRLQQCNTDSKAQCNSIKNPTCLA